MFIKNLNFFSTEERKKDMDILDDMGVSKLSAKVFLKVNYSEVEEMIGEL